MDPNGNHFSINVSFNDNAVRGSGPPLPRSFKPPGHGIHACRPFPGLLTAHQGLYSPFQGKRCYGLFWGLSGDSLYRFINSLLGLSCVWGNSRARVLAIIRGNQTRLCRAQWFSRGLHWAGQRSWRVLLRLSVCRVGLRRTFYSHLASGRKRGVKSQISGGLLLT